MGEEPATEQGGDAPPAASAPPQICFVIGRPRSGTTVFKDMLKTHPALFSVGEIFNEDNKNGYFHFLQKRIAEEPRAVLPSNAIDSFLKYIDWCAVFARERKPRTRILILDVKYDQAHLLCEPWWNVGALPKIYFLIRDRGWKVIDIHRNDIVGLLVSNQIAIKTKIYHSSSLPPGEVQSAKVHINPERLTRDVNATEGYYRRIAQHFREYKKYLVLSYEEMFDQSGDFSPAILDRVCTFLGVENRFDPKPKLEKLLGKDIYSYIENAAEIRELVERRSAT